MYYDDHTEAKLGKVKDPVVRVIKWIKSRSPREKGMMGCLGGLLVSSHPNTTCPAQKPLLALSLCRHVHVLRLRKSSDREVEQPSGSIVRGVLVYSRRSISILSWVLVTLGSQQTFLANSSGSVCPEALQL